MLPREDSLRLQESCDIMCVSSHNTKNEKGVLSGKFPEYLRLDKPIVSLVSGEVPNAELTLRIKQMRVGFAFEYCTKEKDMPLLVNYLADAYYSKSNGITIPFNPDKESVEAFSYPNLTKKLESLIYEIAN
jgi:hypothetical protein